MKEFFKKIWMHKKLTNIVILTLLLLGACFTKWFALIATVYVLVMAIFFSFEENIEVVLFLLPFRVILPFYETYLIFTVLAVKYLIDLIKKKKNLNYITLIPICIFIFYVALPIHATSLKKTILFTFVLGAVYLAFEYRKELNFVNLTRFLCWGLIVSCCFYYFKNVSSYLDQLVVYVVTYKFVRISGLTYHANILMYLSIFIIGSLLICKLNRKMSLPEFFLLFIPTFIFGYLTISRSFVINILIVYVIFYVFYFIKNKRKAWKFLLVLFVVNVALVGCCYLPTKMYLVRFNILSKDVVQEYIDNHQNVKDTVETTKKEHSTDLTPGSEEWKDALINGEFFLDSGRENIHKGYWENYTSNKKYVFFGRGINAPFIGMIAAHNTFLQFLWKHGIVGVIIFAYLLGAYLYCVGKKRLLKSWHALLITIPYLIVATQESLSGFLIWILLIGCESFIESLNKEKDKVKVLYYNTTLNMGGTDMYMLNLIKNANRDKFDFEVIVKTKANSNDKMEKEFENLNIPVKFLGDNIISQITNATKILTKTEYDVMHINATSGAIGIFAYLGKDFGGINNVIYHSHMGGNDNKTSIVDKIGCVLAKNFAEHLVACSDLAAEFMYGKKYCTKHKIILLNNAVDMQKFKYNLKTRDIYRKALQISNKYAILSVGRFVPQKNYSKLIDVFKELCKLDNNCVLLMVGTGELQNEIRNKVKNYKLENKIIFLNERTDVNKIMQAADVFVMTSLHEGLPVVAVEAQASGLPLVLANTITQSTNITGNCTFVELAGTDETWAKTILSQKKFVRVDTSKIMCEKKFDTKSASEVIEQLYKTVV